MATLWIFGCLALGVVLATFLKRSRNNGTVDLGFVSTQWLAEYRQSHES